MTRRGFLRWCATASGAVAAHGLRGTPAALAQPAPKRGGTLRVGFYIEAATMDPHLSGSKIDRQVYHNVYEPLLVLDAKLGIRPGLAESWNSRFKGKRSPCGRMLGLLWAWALPS